MHNDWMSVKNKYLKVFPKEEQNVGALIFALGYSETEQLLNRALIEKVKIEISHKPNVYDGLEYKLIKVTAKKKE